MPELIIYLLKANTSLFLFFLAYHFALRRLTFYSLNRFFLILGLLFSAIYPLIDISGFFSKPETLQGELVVFTQSITLTAIYKPAEEFDYWNIAVWIFWLGVALMTLRLLIQFLSLYAAHRTSERDSYGGFSFRKMKDNVNPFSFLHYIYVNPDQHGERELDSILKHEYIHVKGWHTMDVILAEINLVFFWFNPVSWIYKQAIKENLEFITDQKVLNKGTDRREYQYSLAGICSLPSVTPLGNNFNFLTIKKRIAMMNKKKSSKVQISRYLLILPLLIAFAFVFSVSKAGIETSRISTLTNIKRALAIENILVKPVSSDQKQKAAKTDSAVRNLVVRLRNDSTKATSSLPVSVTYYIDAKKGDKSDMEKLNPAAIQSINVLKGKSAKEFTAGETAEGVIIVTTKQNKDLPSVIEFNQRIEARAKASADTTSPGASTVKVVGYAKNPPVFIIDGKEAKATTLSSMSSESIASVSVLKGEGALAKYGEKGKNGVVVITSKKLAESLEAENEVISILDPASLTKDVFNNISRKFSDSGISVSFDENYSGKQLKELKVALKSKSESASANFIISDLKKNGYLILVKGSPQSGKVSVVSVKKND